MPKPEVPANFAGVFAALVTPRRQDAIEADTAAYLDYMDRVAAAGVNGFVFFGSTGEFIHFEAEERMRVVGLAVKRSRLPVLVNVSHSTFSGARMLADHAMNAGASGVLLMPPYFYDYGQADVEQFYGEFRTALDRNTPLFLYNLPQYTTAIAPETLERLLASGRFAGIKDSSGDWQQLQNLLKLRSAHPFCLLAGHECIYRQALSAGVDGVVSGVAAAIPELPVAMRRAQMNGDEPLLGQLDRQLTELLAWLPRFPPTVALKVAAEHRGWITTIHAVPLAPAGRNVLDEYRNWLARWLPDTLALCQGPAAA